MSQLTLNEPIQVLVDFRPSAHRLKPTVVVPRAFLWRNRRYLIKLLNLVHYEKQGATTLYYFSVSTETNTYKLSFNNSTLEWHLVEVWHE